MSEATTAHSQDHGHGEHHKVPILGLFMALTALTAAEVGLFEVWTRSEALQSHIPKYALVVLILVFTLPKALIVLIYFMHLKFEKQFVVFLAVVPFPFVAIAILPTLIDAQTLNSWGSAQNQVPSLKNIELDHGDHGEDHELLETSPAAHQGTLGEQGESHDNHKPVDEYSY